MELFISDHIIYIVTWVCLKILKTPPNSYFDRENYDNPVDLGLHYFQTNSHGASRRVDELLR